MSEDRSERSGNKRPENDKLNDKKMPTKSQSVDKPLSLIKQEICWILQNVHPPSVNSSQVERVAPHYIWLSDSEENPYEVLSHLFIGDGDAAQDIDRLQQMGITHILNCAAADVLTGSSFYGSAFHYKGIKMDDSWTYDIAPHFDECFEFINDAKSKNGKCLVHCVMGINRSGAVTVAYALKHADLALADTCRRIKQNRHMLLSNDHFVDCVVRWARLEQLI